MDISKKVQDLQNMVLQGQLLEAFDKYYADDVVMQENEHEPRSGKPANRKYEEDFLNSIEEFHGAKVNSFGVNENDGKAYSEWTWDVKFKGAPRVQMNQMSVQTWQDGKVVHEKFYYNEN